MIREFTEASDFYDLPGILLDSPEKQFSGEKQRPVSCTEEFKLQTHRLYHLQGHNPIQEVGLGSLMLKSPD